MEFRYVCKVVGPRASSVTIKKPSMVLNLQKLYVPAPRQLMRFEAKSRSPMYSHFSESFAGVSTIRAYGHEERFKQEAMRHIDVNQRPFFMLAVAER